MHDAVRADGVDARDVEKRPPPIQPGESSQVAEVTRRAVLIQGRAVLLSCLPVQQVPRAILLKPKVVVAFKHLGHDRRQSRAADHDVVVPVEVDDSCRRDHLVLGFQLHAPQQLAQVLEVVEVFLVTTSLGFWSGPLPASYLPPSETVTCPVPKNARSGGGPAEAS